MDDTEGDDRALAGRPVADAAETVAETRPVDRSEARAVLEPVADEGVVTWDGVEARLDQAAEAVSTSEAAFEDVRAGIEAARQTADPVADLDIVADRVEGIEQRFEQVEARVADLRVTQENLAAQLADRRDLFELARQVATLEDNAARTRTTVDDLAEDIGSLRSWLETPDTRHRSLEADLDALEAAIGELAGSIRDLPEPADQSAPSAGAAGGPDQPTNAGDPDPGAVWFDARLQQLVLDLLVADARAEYEALVEWADRVDEASPPPATVGDRLDQLSARCDELDRDLERLERPEWRDQYGDTLDRFEGSLAALEPPVDWATVRSALENVRPDGSGTGQG